MLNRISSRTKEQILFKFRQGHSLPAQALDLPEHEIVGHAGNKVGDQAELRFDANSELRIYFLFGLLIINSKLV